MSYVVKKATAGCGLFAEVTFNRNDKIIQYMGNEVSFETVKPHAKYLMHLDEKTVIDGKCHTNKARYINHSCKPNAQAYICDREVFIYAKRRIFPGEEITISYGKEYWDEHILPKGCRCSFCADRSHDCVDGGNGAPMFASKV